MKGNVRRVGPSADEGCNQRGGPTNLHGKRKKEELYDLTFGECPRVKMSGMRELWGERLLKREYKQSNYIEHRDISGLPTAKSASNQNCRSGFLRGELERRMNTGISLRFSWRLMRGGNRGKLAPGVPVCARKLAALKEGGRPLNE